MTKSMIPPGQGETGRRVDAGRPSGYIGADKTVKRLRTFIRLSNWERLLLLRTAILLSVYRIGLWVLPFRLVQRAHNHLARPRTVAPDSPAFPLNRLRWAVIAAGRYVPRCSCLVRALTAQLMLGRAGIASSLHIGVTKGEKGKFGAHAWLECQGRIIAGESEMEDYSPLVEWKAGTGS